MKLITRGATRCNVLAYVYATIREITIVTVRLIGSESVFVGP